MHYKSCRPAPKLKDATITEQQACELYVECVHMIRRLYQDCHLVHGDLSEYNLLYVEDLAIFFPNINYLNNCL